MGEGLEFSDSDVDVMMCCKRKFTTVFEFDDDAKRCNNVALVMVMDVTNTNPGFTRLRFIDIEEAYRFDDTLYRLCKDSFLSSKQFKEYLLAFNREIATKIHGPCMSTMDDKLDVAMCLPAKNWISLARPWILRKRLSWPSNELIDAVVQTGVLFVPIGCKGSPNEDLEWRISFSLSEKLLIHSFTHTQILCYAALKCVLKDIIQPKHPELLCSYFIKTVMLWLAEETPPSLWIPNNMIRCFDLCLKRLEYCVQHKICLHYFIPDVNFFDVRFNDQQHSDLLVTLKDVTRIGWESILHSNRIQTNNNPFLNNDTLYESNVLAGLRCHCYLFEINTFFGILQNTESSQNAKLCKLYLSYCLVHNVTKHSFVGQHKGNKNTYSEYVYTRANLLIATCSNALCAWSILALLHCCHGDYLKSRLIARHCLDMHQFVKGSVNEMKTLRGTKLCNRYATHLIEPYFDMIEFITISNLLPLELQPRLSNSERASSHQVHRNSATYSKISERNLPNIILTQAPHSCRELRKTGLSTINSLTEDFDLQDLLELRYYGFWTNTLESMWFSFHVGPLLHFTDVLCSYRLNDINGVQRALCALKAEIDRNFTINLLHDRNIQNDLKCLNEAKLLYDKMRNHTQ